MSSLPLIDAALRGMLVALLALVAVLLWRDRRPLPAARAGARLMAGMLVQVVASTPAVEAQLPWLWQAPLIAVSVGNSVLFWLMVRALFDDEFRSRPVHALVWAGVALASLVNCLSTPGAGTLVAQAAFLVQRGAPLLFSVLSIYAAARQWRVDLVESRRRLRLFIVASGVLYSLTMLGFRLAAPQGRLGPFPAVLDLLLLLAMALVLVPVLLKVRDSDLFGPPAALAPLPPARPAAPAGTPAGIAGDRSPAITAASDAEPGATVADPDTTAADDALAQRLDRLMRLEFAYRGDDLTVASLASRLGVPEYRLRRLINRRLGHRNFNAYINGLRLGEVCAVLADPARRDRPVLTVALEAGFQSIGPFNRAFKAATGLTPTEYRREKLADS